MRQILLILLALTVFVGGCAHMSQGQRNYMASRVDEESITDREKFRQDVGECCDSTGNIRSYIIFADFVPAEVYYDSCMKKRGYRIK